MEISACRDSIIYCIRSSSLKIKKVVYLYFERKHLACLVILIHVIQAILVRGK